MKYILKFVFLLIICLLFNACGSVTSTNKENKIAPPLYNAINQGNLEEVIQLVQNGIDINNNAGWSSYSPLEAAARKGQTEIVMYLISEGAENINIAYQQSNMIQQMHYFKQDKYTILYLKKY